MSDETPLPLGSRTVRPTMALRMLRVHTNTASPAMMLQQLWEFSDGTSEWRNVPIVDHNTRAFETDEF